MMVCHELVGSNRIMFGMKVLSLAFCNKSDLSSYNPSLNYQITSLHSI